MRVRRTQEERREQTQDRILIAAIEVMHRRGYAGFRVDEVAKVAGVSRGAQLHYFKTKVDLIGAALTRILQEARREADERRADLLADKHRDLASIVDAMVEDAVAFFFSENFRFSLDMSLAATRDLEVADTVRDIIRREGRPNENVWIELMGAAGLEIEAARDIVWLVRSVARGLTFRSLNAADPDMQDRVIALLRAMLDTHLAPAIETPGRAKSTAKRKSQ